MIFANMYLIFLFLLISLLFKDEKREMKRFLIIFLIIINAMGLFSQKINIPKDSFKTKDGAELDISFIKHSSLIINYEGYYIYIDPVSHFDDLNIDYGRLPKADVILVTHEHFDHLDTKAIANLSKQSTVIYANANCIQQIGRGDIMCPGDRKSLMKNVEIYAVYAYNTTISHQKYHPKSRGDLGFVLIINGMRIYIAGDTEDIPEMKSISNIDIAFLPVNQPFTMTIEQAAKAAKIINPKILYPYHYSDTKISALKDILKGQSIDVRIRNLQ